MENKTYRELDAFIAAHRDELNSEADVERLVDLFMQEQGAKPGITLMKADTPAESAEDYLELADESSGPEEALRYVEKALELDPENIDALCMHAQLQGQRDPNRTLELLGEALEKATGILRREGWFADENVGAFWAIHETRPYMRLRLHYLQLLFTCNKLRLARREAEEMLDLCENDNLGVRYKLMCIYALLEEREEMLALHRRFEESDESQLLLPLCIGFYRLGEMDKAAEYLHRLLSSNPDTPEFVRRIAEGRIAEAFGTEPDGYRPGTLEELLFFATENPEMLIGEEPWAFWAHSILPARTKKKAAKKRNRK